MQTDGAYIFNISSESYRQLVRYRYDPFCAKSKIIIVAEVMVDRLGTLLADSASIPLVSNPVNIQFAEDNPRVFRPGLDYVMKVSLYIPGIIIIATSIFISHGLAN